MHKSFYCSISSTAFGGVVVTGLGNSNKTVVVSHSCFIFHFPDDIISKCLFAMCISFFGEMSVKVFGSFFNWVVCFLIVEF